MKTTITNRENRANKPNHVLGYYVLFTTMTVISYAIAVATNVL
jgi:hypothetical protein